MVEAPPIPAPPEPPQAAPPSAFVGTIKKYGKLLALAVVAGVGYVAHAAWEARQPYEWSGSVEARTVSVGSRIGGRVKSVLVHEGQQVEKGSVLIVLEAWKLESEKLIAQADVDAAEAVYEKLSNGARPQEVAQAYAKLAAARAAAEQAYTSVLHESSELNRTKTLFAHGSVSTADHEAVQTRSRSANAFLAQASARAKEDEAALKLLTAGTRTEDIRAARAQLAMAKARLSQIEVQIEETNIRAPNAVRVESIAVRPGDILRENAPAATVLEVGQLYVRIYVPEPHLGRIHVGQEVPVSVDSFPGRTFRARVDHVNEVGEFTPRKLITTEDRADEVFATRLSLLEGDAELKAGMAAFIHVPKASSHSSFRPFSWR